MKLMVIKTLISWCPSCEMRPWIPEEKIKNGTIVISSLYCTDHPTGFLKEEVINEVRNYKEYNLGE